VARSPLQWTFNPHFGFAFRIAEMYETKVKRCKMAARLGATFLLLLVLKLQLLPQ
jgi:hypothetical protein